MTPPGPKYAIGRLLLVLDEAHRLQRIIRSNEADAKLLSQQMTIHHMLDTTVFGILAEPKRHTSMVSPFPSLLFEAGEVAMKREFIPGYSDIVGESHQALTDAKSILYANAMLTGELIVRIADIASNGVVLISPEHVSEVYGYIASIEHRLSSEPDVSSDAIAERNELHRLLTGEAAAIRDVQGSDTEKGERLRRLVVQRLAALSQRPGLALGRLEQQFQRGRIANAAQVLRFDLNLIAPDEVIVSQWRTRIARAKSSNPVKPNAHALEADAVTLSQLQLFNTEHENERCVLITDDRGLQRAYAAFITEPAFQDHFYAIRDPRQYMPVLNVGETTGAFTDRRVFSRVRDSIDRLVTSFSTNDPAAQGSSHRGSWPVIGRQAAIIMRKISHDFAIAVQNQIGELSDAWVEMLEHTLVAKADIMLDVAEQEILAFGTHFDHPLRSGIAATGSRLSSRFLDLTESSVLLRGEIQILNKRATPANHNRRMLVSDFAEFVSEAFAGRSLIDNVEMLKSIENSKMAGFQNQDRNERLLVLGCMCLDLGAWDAAEALLGTASLNKDTPLARETEFFRCVARRLATRRKSPIKYYTDIESALVRLDGEQKPLLRMRVRSEKIALRLSRWAFRMHLGKPRTKELDQTLSDWRQLTDYGEHRLIAEQPMPAWRGLLKQYSLNTFCLAFWLAEAEMAHSKKLQRVAASLFEKMKTPEFAFIGEGVHGGIYPNLGRYAFAAAPDQTAFAGQIIASIDKASARDLREGILFDLPYIDRIELAYVRRILAKRHGLAEAPQDQT